MRFLADEDVNSTILDALRRAEGSVDILEIKQSEYRGFDDIAILRLAASENRLLISHDQDTMIQHFYQFVGGGTDHPGLIISPQQPAISRVVESLLLIWGGMYPSECRSHVHPFPLAMTEKQNSRAAVEPPLKPYLTSGIISTSPG